MRRVEQDQSELAHLQHEEWVASRPKATSA